jgi:hypothetical protein
MATVEEKGVRALSTERRECLCVVYWYSIHFPVNREERENTDRETGSER